MVAKISYSAKQQRIRVNFKKDDLDAMGRLPSEFVDKCRMKFHALKQQGEIDFYHIDVHGLHAFTEAVAKKAAPDFEGVFTLGVGAKTIEKLLVEPGIDGNTAVLTFQADAETVKTWHFETLRLNIAEQMRAKGISFNINLAQVYGAFLRATQGVPVVGKVISSQPQKVDTQDRGYALLANRARGEISIFIDNPNFFAQHDLMEEAVRQVGTALAKMGQEQDTVKLRERLVDRFKSAARGPELFGLRLPALYLAATFEGTEAPPSDHYLGKGMLKVHVTEDAMVATIENFSTAWYDEVPLTRTWLENELKLLGLVSGVDSEKLDLIEAKIAEKIDITGLVVATGLQPVNASGIFLHHSFVEAFQKKRSLGGDVRESQNSSIVKEGEVIAEFRFEREGKLGKDIYGRPVAFSQPPFPAVSLSEGITLRDERYFIALKPGMPKIEENKITLQEYLVHEGDVDVRSGNVYFGGDMEIKGSIDTGATVEVGGNLTVRGSIRAASVRVKGRLRVEGGIVTNLKTVVRVEGDLEAPFIENSIVVCLKSIKIERTINNSRVDALGDVVLEGGIIGGGRLRVKERIRTKRLGFAGGAETEVHIGMDFRQMNALDRREQRVAKLDSLVEQAKNTAKELQRKTVLNPKFAEEAKLMLERSARLRKIKSAMLEHIQKLKLRLEINKKCRIEVIDLLSTNCRIEVTQNRAPVTQEMIEVLITATKVKGSYFQALTAPTKVAS